MSRTQVVQLLAARRVNWNAADRADYSVILRGGRVVEYGVGQVGSPKMGMMVLVP